MQAQYEKHLLQSISTAEGVQKCFAAAGIGIGVIVSAWIVIGRLYRSVAYIVRKKRSGGLRRRAKKTGIILLCLTAGCLPLLHARIVYAVTEETGIESTREKEDRDSAGESGEGVRVREEESEERKAGEIEAVDRDETGAGSREGQTDRDGTEEAEETSEEAAEETDPSPYVTEGFRIEPTGKAVYEGDILYTGGAVEAFISFCDNNPDFGTVLIRMVPLNNRALQSVHNSELRDGNGSITLKDYHYEEIDEDEYMIRVSFLEEGRWKCTFYCEDLSGNALAGVREGDSEEFVIDTTSPNIDVSYEDVLRITEKTCSPGNSDILFREDLKRIESPENEVFFDAVKAQAEITVCEDNFKPESAKIEIFKETYEEGDEGIEAGRHASGREYSTAGSWVRVSENTYKTKVSLSAEGHYRIVISCTDIPGAALEACDNDEVRACTEEGTYKGPLLTVDRTPPLIQVSKEERVTGNGKMSPAIRIRIVEESFRPGIFRLEDRLGDADGYVFDTLTEEDYPLQWKSRLENGKRISETVLYFEEEAKHELRLSAKDGSGNGDEPVVFSAVYDRTPPVITYTGLDNETGDILFVVSQKGGRKEKAFYFPYVSYAYFHSKKISVRVTATDQISGVEKIVCRFRGSGFPTDGVYDDTARGRTINEQIVIENDSEDDGKDSSKDGSKDSSKDSGKGGSLGSSKDGSTDGSKESGEDGGKSGSRQLTAYVTPAGDQFKGYFQAYALDYKGNKCEEVICRGMVSESEDLHRKTSEIRFVLPEADREDAEGKVKYYRAPPSIKAVYKDDYSGLCLCSLSCDRDKGEHLQKEKEISGESDAVLYRYGISLKPDSDQFQSADSAKPLKLSAYMKDNAGNESRAVYDGARIVVDSQPPEVNVKYDHYDAVNGKYYKKERIAKVTVKDSNFDPEAVLWDIQGKKDSYSVSPWERDGENASCLVTFREDGKNYKIKVAVSDMAGNRTVWDKDREFTIDRKAPKISVFMDRTNVKNESYYKDDKKIRIRIEDENNNPDKIKWKLHGELDGKDLKLSVPEKQVRDSGEKGTVYEIDLNRDGNYSLSLECEDYAGNRSVSDREQFTIDKKKPKLNIEGIRSGLTYTGEIRPSITVSDRNMNSDRVRISMVKIGRGDVSDQEDYHGSRLFDAKKLMAVWGDFEYKPDVDGVYKVIVSGEDLAGNTLAQDKEIMFYVNRFGSVYQIDEATKKRMKHFYLNKEEDIHIREYSVNPVASKVILIRDNEERKELSEQTDYRMTKDIRADDPAGGFGLNRIGNARTAEEASYGGWKRYDYYIGKQNFSEEGVYQLRIESDGYENREGEQIALVKTDNEEKGAPVSFAIDKTPPDVKVGNLDRTAYSGKKHEVSFTVIDNQKLDRMLVTIQSGFLFRKVRKIRVKEKDLDEMNMFRTELKATGSLQKISYEATDRAGNITNSDTVGDSRLCTVTDPGTVNRSSYGIISSDPTPDSEDRRGRRGWEEMIGITAAAAAGAVLLICLFLRGKPSMFSGRLHAKD